MQYTHFAYSSKENTSSWGSKGIRARSSSLASSDRTSSFPEQWLGTSVVFWLGTSVVFWLGISVVFWLELVSCTKIEKRNNLMTNMHMYNLDSLILDWVSNDGITVSWRALWWFPLCKSVILLRFKSVPVWTVSASVKITIQNAEHRDSIETH